MALITVWTTATILSDLLTSDQLERTSELRWDKKHNTVYFEKATGFESRNVYVDTMQTATSYSVEIGQGISLDITDPNQVSIISDQSDTEVTYLFV